MNEDNKKKTTEPETEFIKNIVKKESIKLKAQRKASKNIWFGFGMFGLVGWSVALPTLLGALIGIWLDKHHPIDHSWTLALLVGGLILGCVNAWHWISKEEKEINKNGDKKND